MPGEVQDGSADGGLRGCLHRPALWFLCRDEVLIQMCVYPVVLSSGRHGHGGAGFMPVVGKMVMQSAGSFGLFMGIGGLVRCDDRRGH